MHDWEPDESEAGADPELESGAPAYDLGFGVADALAEANARADADAFNLRMAEHVAGRRYVKVERDLDGESDVHGFLLAASPGWLLLPLPQQCRRSLPCGCQTIGFALANWWRTGWC